MAAVSRLVDNNALASVAVNDSNEEIRKLAVESIRDPTLLKQVVCSADLSFSVKIGAAKRCDDANILRRAAEGFAISNKFRANVRLQAAEICGDRVVFRQVAESILAKADLRASKSDPDVSELMVVAERLQDTWPSEEFRRRKLECGRKMQVEREERDRERKLEEAEKARVLKKRAEPLVREHGLSFLAILNPLACSCTEATTLTYGVVAVELHILMEGFLLRTLRARDLSWKRMDTLTIQRNGRSPAEVLNTFANKVVLSIGDGPSNSGLQLASACNVWARPDASYRVALAAETITVMPCRFDKSTQNNWDSA